jgi:hypothetical protein
MPSLTTRSGNPPQIIVYNAKDASCSGGGWADASIGVDQDLTGIQWNNITGASLTTVPDGGSPTTYTDIGNYGNPNNPINNPDTNTHNNNCYVTLPAGEYNVNLNSITSTQYFNKEASRIAIHNLTDDVELVPFVRGTGNAIGGIDKTGRFVLTGTKNISLRFYDTISGTLAITNLGTSYDQAQGIVLSDILIFTKIG